MKLVMRFVLEELEKSFQKSSLNFLVIPNRWFYYFVTYFVFKQDLSWYSERQGSWNDYQDLKWLLTTKFLSEGTWVILISSTNDFTFSFGLFFPFLSKIHIAAVKTSFGEIKFPKHVPRRKNFFPVLLMI